MPELLIDEVEDLVLLEVADTMDTEMLIIETESPTVMEVAVSPQTVQISEPAQVLEVTITELLVVES